MPTKPPAQGNTEDNNSRIAKDLAGIVDRDAIRKRESGIAGNQLIEIHQSAITEDQGNMLAWPERVVTLNRKKCGGDYLPGSVDARAMRRHAAERA